MPSYFRMIVFGLFMSAAAETATSPTCIVPPEDLAHIKHHLAELRRSNSNHGQWDGVLPLTPFQVSYFWMDREEPLLVLFLEKVRQARLYEPWHRSRFGGIGLTPKEAERWPETVVRLLGESESQGTNSFPATQAGDLQAKGSASPLKGERTDLPRPVCKMEVTVPEWTPSPDSDTKRYIIRRLLDQVAETDVPPPWLRVTVDDFNIDDSALAAVFEVPAYSGQGPSRVFVTVSLNRHLIARPVAVAPGTHPLARSESGLRRPIIVYPTDRDTRQD